MLWAQGFVIIGRFDSMTEGAQIFGTAVECGSLLMHPQRSHHRRMLLLLWWLLLVDRTLSGGVLGRDGQPASSLRQHSHDSILSGEFLCCRVIIYTNGYI